MNASLRGPGIVGSARARRPPGSSGGSMAELPPGSCSSLGPGREVKGPGARRQGSPLCESTDGEGSEGGDARQAWAQPGGR